MSQPIKPKAPSRELEYLGSLMGHALSAGRYVAAQASEGDLARAHESLSEVTAVMFSPARRLEDPAEAYGCILREASDALWEHLRRSEDPQGQVHALEALGGQLWCLIRLVAGAALLVDSPHKEVAKGAKALADQVGAPGLHHLVETLVPELWPGLFESSSNNDEGLEELISISTQSERRAQLRTFAALLAKTAIPAF